MPSPILMRRVGGNAYPNLGAQFAAASTQYATIADNAALSMGAGVFFSLCAWVKHDTVAADQAIITKGRSLGGVAAFEYALHYEVALTRFIFRVSTGAATVNRQFNAINPVVAGTWYFVAATYDGTNINISVDGLAFESTAFSTDVWDSTSPFRIGANATAGQPLNGTTDLAGVWKRALSLAEIQQVRNGTIGTAYKDLNASLKTGLVAWYDFDGDFTDRHGTNHLSPISAPTFTSGKR